LRIVLGHAVVTDTKAVLLCRPNLKDSKSNVCTSEKIVFEILFFSRLKFCFSSLGFSESDTHGDQHTGSYTIQMVDDR
jgi:hypothetical protein